MTPSIRTSARLGPFLLLALGSIALASPTRAQGPDSLPSPSALKKLSLEQLMDLQVTSVSRRPEKLSGAASAIQVITAEEIRRSGASSIPQALRLATNLQVAQVNASQWAISARGFNNVLANKLLVLIDGRTVYTPLYAGVFWDVQNPPLETVDRIEVISGPGGALWGANAVNGVINIITKGSKDTQGLSVEGGAGTELQGFGELRYGARLSPNFHARVYGEAFGIGNTALANGDEARDAWHMVQGGFRLDGTPNARNLLTLQSDLYDGRPDPDGGAPVIARGGNGLGRWTHTISERSDLQLQLYYDRTYRDFGNKFTEDLATYDADFQNRFQLGQRQEVIWGLSVRLMDHQTTNLALFAFTPAHKLLHLYSGFVQDEIAVVKDRLRLTLGSKFEHNDYTGFEIQPSARLTWNPTENQTFWTAVSRAVRTPSRIDRDFFLYAAPGVAIISGDDFQSETVLAYELGWRFQTAPRFSLSISTFYNEYDNLRSVEPGPPPNGIPLTFQNGVKGHSYGVELSTVYQVSDRWKLRGGYTYLGKDLSIKKSSSDLNQGTAEADDPKHQFLIQSSVDLPGRIQWDATLRYADKLPKPYVPHYFGLDVRLGWNVTQRLEISVTGQNLLEKFHREFIPGNPGGRKIERGIYGKITWR